MDLTVVYEKFYSNAVEYDFPLKIILKPTHYDGAMDNESWRNWSLTSEGLRWRVAVPEDLPFLTRLLDAAHLMMGAQERPDLFEFPVVLTLVAEDASGAIVDGLYVEMEASIRKLGLNRQGMMSAEALAPALGAFLVSRKIRIGRVAAPSRIARVMRSSLKRMGLVDVTESFRHWAIKLRP